MTTTRLISWTGVVLAGGRSRRFGSDKAFATVDGDALVAHSVRRLSDAGASEVMVVGGDTTRMRAMGVATVEDRFPGEGPLGGVLTALGSAHHTLLVVTACDLPALCTSTIAALAAAMVNDSSHVVAVPTVDGREQWHVLALWLSAAGALQDAFFAGERAIRDAMRNVPVARLPIGEAIEYADVDTPADLDRYAAGRARDGCAPMKERTERDGA